MQEDFITKILGIQGFSVADIKFGWKKDKEVVIIYLKREYKYCCCSKCGISVRETHSHREYWAWDLPMSGRRVRLVFEKFRVKCPRCGIKTEKLPFIDNRSHCTNRLEQVIAHRCKGATVKEVANDFDLSWDVVKRIDKKYINRSYSKKKWNKLRVIGVDEIASRKGHNYFTVVSDLERGEVIWVGEGRTEENLDAFFKFVGRKVARRIRTACIDMWEAYENSIRKNCPQVSIIYDKFHVLQHLNKALNEVRKEEFWRQGGWRRELVKGKKWLLLSRWKNLERDDRRDLNELLKLNRKLAKAYLLKEIFDRLWEFTYIGAAKRFLANWISQLRWSRLPALKRFAKMILAYAEGILNYCREKVNLGFVEGINNKIKNIKRKAYGYREIEYFKLKII